MDKKFKRLHDYLQTIVGGDAELAALAGQGLDEDVDGLELARAGDGAAGKTLTRRLLEFNAAPEAASPELYAEVEAIIDAKLRPAVDVIGGKFAVTHGLWRHLSNDNGIRANIERALTCIGRIELPGSDVPYGGTGFIVGKGLLMTNRHVAELFAHGLGDRKVVFRAGELAAVNFTHERGVPPARDLSITKIVMIHPYWDMALLQVEGLPGGQAELTLSDKDARQLPGREICVVGYPGFDPRNPADVQNDVFAGRYGIKRLQPGKLKPAVRVGSFGKVVDAAGHDCSTLGGNSGSALYDPRDDVVLALHFGGAYRRVNYAVPSSELGADPRVIDAGVRYSGGRPTAAVAWAEWWDHADSLEEPGAAAAPPPPVDGALAAQDAGDGGDAGGASSSLTVEIPIRVTISVGSLRKPGVAVQSAQIVDEGVEKLVKPWSDSNYSTRKGYDPDFLEPLVVPIPAALDPSVLAPTVKGGDILHYQNFSIAMHARRRLALFTASNVTREARLRKPDPSALYTRRALSGLGESDQEKWFVDDRMDARYQLPDVFFTKDRKAFDKGHIVRRDDIAFGKTYAALRRANGDSYHVTNCSPQVGAFNQSAKGVDNWGDLENHVLASAKSERLCVFAGPVLHNDDPRFVGVGDEGVKLVAKIPTRFWKVVVAMGDEGLEVFAFVLEQDLSNVQMEFVVPDNFKPNLWRLPELQELTGVEFDDALHDADQYESIFASEMVQRGVVGRRR